MTLRDRMEAIRRNPQYLKERARAEVQSLAIFDSLTPDHSEAALAKANKPLEEVVAKWGFIPTPPSPQFLEKLGVRSFPSLPNYDFIKRIAKARRLFDSAAVDVGVDKKTRRLWVVIDLNRRSQEIGEVAVLHAKFWQSVLKIQNKGRSKPTRVDPWVVWDLRQGEKQSLLAITKKLCGIQTNPTDDDHARKYLMQVCRAYAKAQKMIKQVGEEASS